MPDFSIGLSALKTSQFALNVISNNVSNSQTEGYHRQRVDLGTLPPNRLNGFEVGRGVSVQQITRLRDQVTEASLTTVTSDVANVDRLVSLGRKIESALVGGENAMGPHLDRFFGEFTKLTSSPYETAQRTAVVKSGKQLTAAIRDSANQLTQLQVNVKQQMEREVGQLNDEMAELSRLNRKITDKKRQGLVPNVELDQRDALFKSIAAKVGFQQNETAGSELHLTIGNRSIEQGSTPIQFRFEETDGQIQLFLDDSDRPLSVQSGSLAALVETHNSVIPGYRDKLDQTAGKLIQQFNQVHATGVGVGGSFETLFGNRSFDPPDIPLHETSAGADLAAGQLHVTLHEPSGERRIESISIDPATESLDDVAAKLTAISGLNANITPDTNQLQLRGEGGLRFDFAGGIPSAPDLSSYTGTSVPSFSGDYEASANHDLTVRIVGSGDVGITDGLKAEIRSATDGLLATVNLGNGYEAGSEIELDDGIRLTFDPGTVLDSEEFTTRLVGSSDETGLLASAGLNQLFSGHDAATIDIDQRVDSNHELLASGRNGDASDTSKLMEFIALKDEPTLPGNRTLSEYVAEIGTEIGYEISSNQSLGESLETLRLQLEQERDAKSGVDLNEELVYLQQYQKSYEAAVRVIQTADEVMNELLSIFR
jgi:flagellar hook-associated protein FlgK